MKYLKLFEDLNVDGFEEVSYDDFCNDTGETFEFRFKRLNFRKRDKDMIYLSEMGFFRGGVPGKQTKYKDFMEIYLDAKRGARDIITVYKSVDEWYYVEKMILSKSFKPEQYYRCDQLDGLINCLEKLGVNKKKSKISESLELDSNGFEEISKREWNNLTGERIGTSFKPINFNKDNKDTKYLNSIGFAILGTGNKPVVTKKVNGVFYSVFRGSDEWYYVSISGVSEEISFFSSPDRYYKCDQLDGLINCLNYLNVTGLNESLDYEQYFDKPIFSQLMECEDYDVWWSTYEMLSKECIAFTSSQKEELRKMEFFIPEITNKVSRQFFTDTVSIYKMPDEWYYVGTDYKFYKCDQWDGLLACLEKIGIL